MSQLPAPVFTAPVQVPGQKVYAISWPSIQGAAVYQVFLDGVAASTLKAYAGATQGCTIAVQCGQTHTINLRAGDSTAKPGAAAGWGALGVKHTWTVPPC